MARIVTVFVIAAIFTLVVEVPVAYEEAVVIQPAEPPAKKVEVRRYELASRHLKFRELILEITAYTAHDPGMDGRGITFTGLPVDKGVLAVDPEIIPLGSIVWIPGVGYVVALDTGGAIKGYRADLYLPDRESALRWGRRTVKVRVVE